MTTSKKRNILLIILLCAVVIFGIFAFAFPKKESQQGYLALAQEVAIENIQDVYMLNDQKSFPEQISIGQDKIAGGGIIIYPDGQSYKIVTDKIFTLDLLGQYTLRYFYIGASIDKNEIYEKHFNVNDNLYYLSSYSGSSITPVYAQDMTEEYLTNLSQNVTSIKQDGLILRLSSGSVFSYAEPININNSNDEGKTHIITFDPLIYNIEPRYNKDGNLVGHKQDAAGSKNANMVVITLTDCYDQGIYTKIYCDMTNGIMYFRGGTETLHDMGIMEGATQSAANGIRIPVYYDGVRGLAWYPPYGGSVNGTGYTYWDGVNKKTVHNNTYGISLWYEKETCQYWISSKKSDGSVGWVRFADFINPDIYGELEYKPFTSGEVYLSVECADYQTSGNARVDIFSIAENNGTFLADRFEIDAGYKGYQDSVCPIIDTQLDIDFEKGIKVAVGESFFIPNAFAKDVNLTGEVKTSVYKNFYDENHRTSVSITNNSFKIASEDVYYVEYLAKDIYGNTTQKILKVYGINNGENRTISLNYGTKLTQITCGEKIALPAPTNINTLNNEDEIRLVIQANMQGKEPIQLFDMKGKANIEAYFDQNESLEFIPLYSGEYSIDYKLCDDIFNYFDNPINYKVNSIAGDNIAFLEKPFIQRALIKGASYKIDKVLAYSFSSGGPVAIENVKAYISYDGSGNWTEITNLNAVEISGSTSAQIKFSAEGAQDAFSDTARIIDVGFNKNKHSELKVDKYFISDSDGLIEVNQKGSNAYVVKSIAQTGNTEFGFANMISIKDFNFEYMIEEDYANYQGIKLTLSDPYNLANKVSVKVFKSGNDLYASVNDGFNEKLTNDNFASNKAKLIQYSEDLKVFSFSGTTKKIAYESKFSSSFAYLDIELCGISGNAGILVRTINNQDIKKNVPKKANPQAIHVQTLGQFAIDDVITINPINFADVLTPVNFDSIQMTVKLNNNVLTSIDGVKMNGADNDPTKSYQIKLTEYGQYRVEYMGRDAFGNLGRGTYLFEVNDKIAPVINIEIDKDKVAIARLNTNFVINYQIGDNVNTEEELAAYIIVTEMKTMTTYYYTTKEISFSTEGYYEVSIICKDVQGNYARESFYLYAQP